MGEILEEAKEVLDPQSFGSDDRDKKLPEQEDNGCVREVSDEFKNMFISQEQN